MAGNRPRNGSGSMYIHDNVARKPITNDVVPKRPQIDKTPKQHLNRKIRIRRNQQKALQIDGIYLMGLVIAMVCILYVCMNYLQLQSSITVKMDQIKLREQEIKDLRTKNDMLQTQINTNLDLEYVYKVATEELGMVYANQEQVILYEKTESEYVRQYEDIPR